MKIGSNGVIGLGEEFNSITIHDIGTDTLKSRRIICPFWVDLLTVDSIGNIYYQTYQRFNVLSLYTCPKIFLTNNLLTFFLHRHTMYFLLNIFKVLKSVLFLIRTNKTNCIYIYFKWNIYPSLRGIDAENDLFLRKANTIVRLQFADFPEFEASWIVKVTWENMTVFGDKSKVRSILKIILEIIWYMYIIKQI